MKTDILKSITLQKLVYKERWLDFIDYLIIYSIFGFIVVFCITEFKEDFMNRNDKLTSTVVFSLLTLSCLYVIFRKATEKNLIKVKTHLKIQNNKKILMEFANRRQLGIYYESENFLIFTEVINLYPRWDNSIIFIISGNFILFTILRDRPLMPTLGSHLFQKQDLKKLFISRSQN